MQIEDDNKTIFSADLDSDERAGRDAGYERGKRIALKEQPKRFGLARQRALGKKKYDEGYVRIFGHRSTTATLLKWLETTTTFLI